jgi:CheY-like chemotaxis protein
MNELAITPQKKSLAIWIVEDDLFLNEMSRACAEGEGHTTRCFETAEGCLQALGSEPTPDLILLDIHLPGKDGTWLCQEIRRRQKSPNPQTLPWIIAHTSEANPSVIDAIMNAGANDHLGKPLTTQKLRLKLLAATYNIARIQALKLRISMLEKMVAENSHR